MEGIKEGGSITRKSRRSTVEEELSLGNNKALNALLCVVDVEVFKMISSCKVTKEAWEVLETTSEDIANESFALGEVISNEKLVRKVLRTLPKRFAYKVTIIEEAQDLMTMRIDRKYHHL
ncbi:hypothetical protein LIER_10780 [Lithospermum erythrorhizon]|uniref:Gag-pol polyprotein n=1 Tax=Lithospermum erythrorhizon TaxID=34254 RepID=A0AAV3PKV4_LITER